MGYIPPERVKRIDSSGKQPIKSREYPLARVRIECTISGKAGVLHATLPRPLQVLSQTEYRLRLFAVRPINR